MNSNIFYMPFPRASLYLISVQYENPPLETDRKIIRMIHSRYFSTGNVNVFSLKLNGELEAKD